MLTERDPKAPPLKALTQSSMETPSGAPLPLIHAAEVPSQPQPEAVPPSSAAHIPAISASLMTSPWQADEGPLDVRPASSPVTSPGRISPTTVQIAIRQQQRFLLGDSHLQQQQEEKQQQQQHQQLQHQPLHPALQQESQQQQPGPHQKEQNNTSDCEPSERHSASEHHRR